jgi:hypothetical protein
MESNTATTEELRIAIDGETEVSGLLTSPASPVVAYVFGHGAGAGMAHHFMADAAAGLAAQGVATLRYNFPYMEKGSRRPDLPKVAQAAVRAAVAEAARRLPGVPLFAGGKSFGGRMSSQAQAAQALPGVKGLVFFGFPLHPAGEPSIERAKHLAMVELPMLFLQGTRDELADLDLIRSVTGRLGEKATLKTFEDADHSFHVRAKSGWNDAQVMAALVDTAAGWMASLV